MALTAKYQLEIFADYSQFYLMDEQSQADTSEIWNKTTTEEMLATGSGLIAIGTARNYTVPVVIEIWDAEPSESSTWWDKVNDCPIELPSGNLVVMGCTDYFPDALRIPVTPGSYKARV